MSIADRKDSHLALCLEEQVEPGGVDPTGFGALRLEHDALPELDLADVRTDVTLLGRRLAAPLLVGAMTGGTARAGAINARLAAAATRCGVGFALGSQRRMLQDPSTRSTYAVRDAAPDLPLLVGNLGAAQLVAGVGVRDVARLVADVGCDAFAFHLNPLQEAIQPEGEPRFAGVLQRLRAAIPDLPVPVLLKEVGAGISETTARKIRDLPVAGVEAGGVGGTSWSRVEGLRSSDPARRALGERFATWGIPTAESVATCRRVLPDRVVIASGGIRDGIQVAKAIALGADAAAIALPLLRAAERSEQAAVEELERVVTELRVAMFLTGSRTVADLRARAPIARALPAVR